MTYVHLILTICRVLADKLSKEDFIYHPLHPHVGIVCCLLFITKMADLCFGIFAECIQCFLPQHTRTVIPQMGRRKYYRETVGYLHPTYQLLGILGPALAGIIVATWQRTRIFYCRWDYICYCSCLNPSIPASLAIQRELLKLLRTQTPWKNVWKGIPFAFETKSCFALSINLSPR